MHLAAIVRFVSAPQRAFNAYDPPRLPVGQQKANLWAVKSQPWGNKKSDLVSRSDRLFGGAKGIRTPDLLIANETRYQLRHSPKYRMMVAPASGDVANHHCPTALGQWLSSSMSQSAGAARRGLGPAAGRSAVGMMTVLVTGADRSMVRTVRGTSGFET